MVQIQGMDGLADLLAKPYLPSGSAVDGDGDAATATVRDEDGPPVFRHAGRSSEEEVFRTMGDGDDEELVIEGADAMPTGLPMPARQAAFKGDHWE